MSGDPIAERVDEILRQVKGQPRIDALPEAERVAWARGQAERELASVAWLPGGLSWQKIEATYRRLAAGTPGLGPDGRPYRRQRRDQPSRPETAAGLLTSAATLRRACVAAGRGPQWPPRGL